MYSVQIRGVITHLPSYTEGNSREYISGNKIDLNNTTLNTLEHIKIFRR